jgi:hypothetical protein
MRNYKRSGFGAKPGSKDGILSGFGFRIFSAPLRRPDLPGKRENHLISGRPRS